MPIDIYHTPAEVTEEAARKFEAWKTISYNTAEYEDTINVRCGYIARGASLLHDLATTHFERKKPGFWARFFRTKAAREYAAERKLMETMIKELKIADPHGDFGGYVEENHVVYDDYAKRDKVTPMINIFIYDMFADYKEADLSEEAQRSCYGELDRAFYEIDQSYLPEEQRDDVASAESELREQIEIEEESEDEMEAEFEDDEPVRGKIEAPGKTK